MEFTVTYPLITHPASPEFMSRSAVTQFAQRAEAVGFDGIGFTDHPAPTDRWLQAGGHDALDPYVALTFCSAVTERIRLIPNIVVLPYRHPLIVAKTVATMAMLSEDRFTLAVATGYLRGEYRGLGIDFEQRNALFDQAIEVMRGMWTQDDFSFQGLGIDAKGLTANPKPRIAPPIWIGGNSRLSRRRVARYGDGWTPFPAPGPSRPPRRHLRSRRSATSPRCSTSSGGSSTRRGGTGRLSTSRSAPRPGAASTSTSTPTPISPRSTNSPPSASPGWGSRLPAPHWRSPSKDWSAMAPR